jgi:hypothetical protein
LGHVDIVLFYSGYGRRFNDCFLNVIVRNAFSMGGIVVSKTAICWAFEARYDYYSARTVFRECLLFCGIEDKKSFDETEVAAIRAAVGEIGDRTTGVSERLSRLIGDAPPPTEDPPTPEPVAVEPPAPEPAVEEAPAPEPVEPPKKAAAKKAAAKKKSPPKPKKAAAKKAAAKKKSAPKPKKASAKKK